jgi:hypothetical protein
MASNKDFRHILEELERQRWAVEQTTKGHYRAAPPDPNKRIITFSLSNEPRAIHNTISQLKTSGFLWPPPDKLPHEEARAAAAENDDPDAWIDEHNRKVEEASAPVEEEPLPPETHEERMDRLFHELKEAKTYVALADEQYAVCEAKLLAAQREFEQAQDERKKAREALQAKKTEFDSAFSEDGRAA